MKKAIRRSVLAGMLGLLVLSVFAMTNRGAAAQPSSTKPITIWPLGDSITYGAGVAGGYRESLYTNLTARGYSVKLVGTSDGNATPLLTTAGQAHHDGHSGYSIADIQNTDGSLRKGIYERVDGWHDSIEAPDVILLLIGTNDLNPDLDVDHAPKRLDRLVSRLFSCFPNTHILIATVPDGDQNNRYRHGAVSDLASAVRDYNSAMKSIVAKRKTKGQHITLVDMHAALTLSDLRDGLHPSAEGYVKMGNVWAEAVAAEFPVQ